MLLVDVIIHKREVGEDDNILVEQILDLLLQTFVLSISRTGDYMADIDLILFLIFPYTTEISRTTPELLF